MGIYGNKCIKECIKIIRYSNVESIIKKAQHCMNLLDKK